jgi:hypothetical protein
MNAVSGGGSNLKRQTYILEPNDLSYTFAIPKKVIEFDKKPMENNIREKRLSQEELFPEEDKKPERPNI